MNKWELLADKIFLHFKEIKNRSYPLLLTKERIEEELEKLKKNPDSFYLLDECDGEIQGLCGYFTVEKEKYLQTTIFISFNQNQKFIKKSLNYLIEIYPDYTLNIGVEAENSFVINEIKKKGFWIIDDLYSATIQPNTMNCKEYTNIEKIDLSRWGDFEKIHQHCFGEGYWTFDRIKNNFSIWEIYSIKENDLINAYTFIKNTPANETCEIFGIHGDDTDERLSLIEHSLASLKGKKMMYYFIEDNDEMEACKEFGFAIQGHYQCWTYKQKKCD